jgi:hypothetical protein
MENILIIGIVSISSSALNFLDEKSKDHEEKGDSRLN